MGIELRRVPASAGWRWAGSGLLWLRRQPWQALLLVVGYALLITLLSAVPWVGGLLPLLALQIATVGFNQAARQIDRGQPVTAADLFAGLRAPQARRRQLLTLSVLYCGAVVATLLASSALDGGTLLQLALFSDVVPAQALAHADALRHAALLAAALYAPLAAAFWFAPLLVCWHGMGAWQALFSSLLIVLRNLPAFLVYCLIWLGLFTAVPTLIAVAANSLGAGAQTAVWFGLPAVLLLLVAFVLSFYASARSLLPGPDAGAGG